MFCHNYFLCLFQSNVQFVLLLWLHQYRGVKEDVSPVQQYLLCSDPVGNGLLHRLPRQLSHNYVGEAVEHFTEESHQSNLKF